MRLARLGVAVLLATLPLLAPAVAADEPTQQLRRDGRWLVDDHGRVVLVHGVNAVWKHAPYYPPDVPEGFTAADADWLAAHGFNGVRIGTLWVGVTPEARRAPDTDWHVSRLYAFAREMGASDVRAPPFFFTKPADAVVASGAVVPFPSRTADLHHEIELVVALGRGAGIFGYSVGNDLTRRDVQAQAKKDGRPWDTAKGFDHSAPVAPIARAHLVDPRVVDNPEHPARELRPGFPLRAPH